MAYHAGRVLLPFLALAPLAAGLTPSELWPDGPDHDHDDPAHHLGFGQGLVQMAQLRPFEGPVGEIDLAGGMVVAALAEAPGSLAVLDVSSPEWPTLLGSVPVGAKATDVKFLPGGTRALVSTEGTDRGIRLVDLHDPRQPRIVGSLLGHPTHMMDVATIDGIDYVFATNGGVVKVVAVLGDLLIPVGELWSGGAHDVTVRWDPATGKYLAYVAAWHGGVRVFDVSRPWGPQLQDLGRWDPDDIPCAGAIHTVMPTEVAGRRIVVAGQEDLASGCNLLFILDATDLGNITSVGRWRNPDGKEGGLMWSTHNFNLRDGKVYLAHYHGGVLVLGLRGLEDLSSPPLLAHLLPTGERATAQPGGWPAPMTWDVVPGESGTVFVGDMSLGVVVLREA